MGTRTKLGVFPRHSFPHSPNPSLSQTPGSSSLATPYMLSVYPALAGEVTTLQTLDRERQNSYQLLVQVQDAGSPPAAPQALCTSQCLTSMTTALPSCRPQGLLVEASPYRYVKLQGPALKK